MHEYYSIQYHTLWSYSPHSSHLMSSCTIVLCMTYAGSRFLVLIRDSDAVRSCTCAHSSPKMTAPGNHVIPNVHFRKVWLLAPLYTVHHLPTTICSKRLHNSQSIICIIWYNIIQYNIIYQYIYIYMYIYIFSLCYVRDAVYVMCGI